MSFSDLLAQRAYRHLLAAQVTALLGTGLLTVALSLLAFDVSPDSAGAVVATALSIKMVAYVVVAPAANALTSSWPPRVVMVTADMVRALVALALPWVGEVWQVYVLIFVLQAASAAFTPTYQALLPAVLPHRDDYTRALSFSRLAYDLEAVVSPLVAAAALLLVSYHSLFLGTAIGFLLSAVLVLRSRSGHTPPASPAGPSFGARTIAGLRMFATRRSLRALVALDLAAAGTTATALVNTVVVTRQTLGRGEGSVAVALGVFGSGSMVVAIALPRILERRSERQVMLTGAATATVALAAAAAVTSHDASWTGVMVVWFVLGAAGSMVLTPTGQVIAAAVREDERAAAFAAHFSLSHACYLMAYPVAGWVGGEAGVPWSVVALAGITGVATILAATTWRTREVVATRRRQEQR